MMMFINSFLSLLALTCLCSFPSLDHKQVNGLEPKRVVQPSDNVSISDVDNVLQLSAYVYDQDMSVSLNTQYSMTLIGNSDIHGFNGANHKTIKWNNRDMFQNFDTLDYYLAHQDQDYGTYYLGVLDQWYYNTNAGWSIFFRQYFVNPKTLGQGVFYIDDKTWHNIYDNTLAWDSFGSWITDYDYIYGTLYPDSLTIDDYLANVSVDLICPNQNTFTLYKSSTLNSLEPQRHYGNTFTINGSSNGQNVNENYLSFLPYVYCYFCADDDELGDLYNKAIDIYLYHGRTDYLQSYQNGYDEGYQQGQNEGYQTGYKAGQEAGEETGYNSGYQAGYQTGYTNGFDEADNMDETALVIFTGIIDVGLLPVNFFLACLNFEVFGINIGAFVSALLTVAITIIVIRVIVGGKKDD